MIVKGGEEEKKHKKLKKRYRRDMELEGDMGGGRNIRKTSSTIGGGGCNIFVPVLRGNGTKIAPPGYIFDQPPHGMSWIRGSCRGLCRGSRSLIPGRGCFDDLPGDEIVVSPPSLIVEPLVSNRVLVMENEKGAEREAHGAQGLSENCSDGGSPLSRLIRDCCNKCHQSPLERSMRVAYND